LAPEATDEPTRAGAGAHRDPRRSAEKCGKSDDEAQHGDGSDAVAEEVGQNVEGGGSGVAILRHVEIGGSGEREQCGGDGHRDDHAQAPAHQRAPPIAGKKERDREHDEDEHDEHDAQPVEQVNRAAGLFELACVQQLDLQVLLAGVLRDGIEDRDAPVVEALDHRLDDRCQIEDHLAVLDRDVLALARQGLDDGCVGALVGVPPQGLELIAREGSGCGVACERLDARGDRCGKELGTLGKCVLRPLLDVHL